MAACYLHRNPYQTARAGNLGSNPSVLAETGAGISAKISGTFLPLPQNVLPIALFLLALHPKFFSDDQQKKYPGQSDANHLRGRDE
jgi:hypothetical protein